MFKNILIDDFQHDSIPYWAKVLWESFFMEPKITNHKDETTIQTFTNWFTLMSERYLIKLCSTYSIYLGFYHGFNMR